MPIDKVCRHCNTGFEITNDDLAFYEKISPIFGGKKFPIPPPTLGPECRLQRKLAWRNERTLYQRNCNLCGKNTVTVHAPDHPYPVYCNPCWWSDGWNPISFGIDYDPARSFFEQYSELMMRVPQRAMVNDDGVASDNCAYTFDVAFSKNCYMSFGMWKAQDCLYCRICDQSKFCVDCEGVKLGSELVYESLDSQRLYRCSYLQNSENCNDCFFGFDLKGCSDCIGCVGLRQKRFHIFNKQYSEDEYKKMRADFRLNTRSCTKALQDKFRAFSQKFPRKNMNLQNCEDCLGDHLFNCRKVIGYVNTNSEYSKWIERSDGPRYCYDIVQAGLPELCYECITVDNGYMSRFSTYCNQTKYSMYSDNCIHCSEIFGCISLRQKSFCVLNKQYSKEEYAKIAATITENMITEGVFGEFLPAALSIYGYNETNALESFPISREEAIKYGWKWRDNLPYTKGKETIRELPDNIDDVKSSITKEILACAICNKNYRVVIQEYEFYRKMRLPLPDKCPNCRNTERLSHRSSQKLWKRECGKCRSEIYTTYAPDRPEIVYCEKCYLETVY